MSPDPDDFGNPLAARDFKGASAMWRRSNAGERMVNAIAPRCSGLSGTSTLSH
jgi:hypothetical protein